MLDAVTTMKVRLTKMLQEVTIIAMKYSRSQVFNRH